MKKSDPSITRSGAAYRALKRILQNYRQRLKQRKHLNNPRVVRFEGPGFDGGSPRTGGVLAALRRSPLVGSGISLRRSRLNGRDVEL